MASSKPDNILRLKDGRSVGYAEYGDPEGEPLFYFHGHPGSRVEAELGDAAAARQGVRIIGLDRPGYGRSDFKPGRRLLDWPDDVTEAANALHIGQFAVLGVSGGGPYAAACAFKIPRRLTAVGIVSGVAPFNAPEATKGMRWPNRLGFGAAGHLPWVARLAMWWMASRVRRSPERVIGAIERALTEPDRRILSRPEVRKTFKRIVAEAFRTGSRGAAWDMTLLARPWGFQIEDITVAVHLWQGEEDVLAPPSMGRYLAGAIPDCRARFYPGEGHLLVVDRLDEIHAALFPSGGV
jgi:pimeloyl-ACP methyl ester carboxylesterase